MKKLLLFAFILSFFAASAQKLPIAPAQPEKCGTDLIHRQLLESDPRYRSNFLQGEERIREELKKGSSSRMLPIYTIPVVVHIIHTGEAVGTGVNISDAQVQSAITALNNDFRKKAGTNGDGTGVDTEIEFCLAVRDPNGQPTTGIVRVNGSGVAKYSTEGINVNGGTLGADEVTVKGLSRWPNTSYYNIWIVNEISNNNGGSGTQGYAYFPGATASKDGAVILYNAFGTTGTLKSYTNKNRTATHELGHGLNLYHSFQGDGTGTTCPSDADCGTNGDCITDTPRHMRSNSDCVTGTNTCTNTSKELYIHNYMDYSSETCQNAFTQGQKDRMRAAISNLRSSLLTSTGCTPVYSLDAGISNVVSPAANTCYTTLSPVVTLMNYGSTTLTSVTIRYNIDGGPNSTFNWTGSLASNTSVNVTLNSITYTAAPHTFNVFTSAPNGGTDQNTANDAYARNFTVSSQALPYSETFESTTFPPTNWTRTGDVDATTWGNDGVKTWERRGTSGNGTSTASAAINNYNYPYLGKDYLQSPAISLSGYASATLTFKVAYRNYPNSANYDTLRVYVSEDCGTTFTSLIYNKNGTGLATSGSSGLTFAPTASTDWRTETVSLNTFAGKSVVLLFEAINAYGNNLYLDDISVTGMVAPVAGFSATPLSGCEPLTVAFKDTSSGSPTSWAWDIDNNGTVDYTTQNPTHIYSTPGVYTVKLTVTNGAGSNSTTKTDYITVNAKDNASFSYSSSSYCQTGINPTPTVTGLAGGTFSATPTGLTINPSTGTITLSSSAVGTYTVKYTTNGTCPNNSSVTVSITAPPSASFSYAGPYCKSSAVNPSPTLATGATAGTFSSTTGLVFVSTSTGQINLAASVAGTYTVTNTIAASGGCAAASATASVTIDPAAVVNAGIDNTVCSGSTFTTSGTMSGAATSVTWTSTGSGTFTNAGSLTATYSPSAADITAGSVKLIITSNDPAGSCTAAVDTMVLTINPAAVVNAGADATVCFGNTYSYSGTMSGSATSVTWSTSGSGSFSSINSLTGTYSPSPADQTAGSVNLILTSNDPAGVCPAGKDTVKVTINPDISVTVSNTSVTCFGLANGTATATVTGGTSGYTYSWSPSGGTGAMATGLAAGSYTVTVTDSKGCKKTATTTITQPTALSATTSTTQATCGGANGSASVTASGGTTGYTYSWAPSGGTGSTATGLAAGTYTVTVTDANGCTKSATATVTNASSLTVSTSTTSVSCNGGTNGSATASASGGTPGYTYNWAPTGGTGSTANNLAAGTYTVTVTDASGCQSTATATVTQPAALTVSITKTDVSCNGGTNGSATATVSGGTSGYTYSWAPSGGTTATATNLSAGTYTVTVTDSKTCVTTGTVTITQPAALTVTVSKTDVSCNGGANGTATASVTGGTSGYTYSWSPSGGTSSTATGLSAGTYTVTVTDSKGCTKTATTTINQPQALSVTVTKTDVSCPGGSNGSATASVTGGTSGYTYSWAPSGGTTATASNLASGSYTVTVTDSKGCTKTATTTITEPKAIAITFSKTDVSCNGGTDGSATATVTGGTAGYTYSWSPSGGTGTSATNLVAGTYTLTVTDNNGCTKSGNITITQPQALAVSVSKTDVSCNGGTNGTATAAVTGGTSGYSYSWSPTGGTSSTATALSAGNYVVSVTDSKGCVATASVSVAEPAAITLTTSSTSATCGLSDGSASVTVSGGNGGNTFSWSPTGGTASTTANIPAGSYTVTVTDSKGCVASKSVVVGSNSPLSLSISTVTGVTCFGGADGSLTANGSGSSGYTYSLNGGTFQSSGTFSGLAAGTYNVTVKDANGCTASQSASVSSPDAVTFTETHINVSSNGGTNGSITLTANGGTGTYVYVLNGTSSTTSTFSGLAAGTYTVTVTDANGCTAASQSVTLTQPDAPVVTLTSTNASCTGCCDGSATVSSSGGAGPYSVLWSNGSTDNTITGLCPGTYEVCVTDNNGSISCDSISIADAPVSVAVHDGIAIDLYPNPAEEKLFVNAYMLENSAVSVRITNLLGEILAVQNFTASVVKTNFAVNHLAGGVYFLTITQGEKQRTLRFIKN